MEATPGIAFLGCTRCIHDHSFRHRADQLAGQPTPPRLVPVAASDATTIAGHSFFYITPRSVEENVPFQIAPLDSVVLFDLPGQVLQVVEGRFDDVLVVQEGFHFLFS